VRSVLKRLIPERRRAGTRYSGLTSPGTQAVPLINNRCGAVRLNLIGREPNGAVQPGAEAEAVLDDLTRALYELRQPSSGEPIVASVRRAAEVFGPDHHPDVPDLLVAFRRDLGVLDECESPRVGRVRVAPNGPWMPRSGDHTDHSRLWVVGPNVVPGTELRGDVLDVAPTVLAALGVAAPSRYDGRALDVGAPAIN
jgi:predicted AlkP superfamily phosphohydrolase/phosphomutase